MDLYSLEVGDFILAKRSKIKIKNKYQISMYLVIRKTKKRVYALFCTTSKKDSDTLFKMKIQDYFKNNKKMYISFNKIENINKNQFIKKINCIEKEELNLINKNIFILLDRNYDLKHIFKNDLKYNLGLGDIIRLNDKNWYLKSLDLNYYYVREIYKVKDHNMGIKIKGFYYYINYQNIKKISRKEKYILISVPDYDTRKVLIDKEKEL